jgi:peptide/nickel transport system substrate-binding protein
MVFERNPDWPLEQPYFDVINFINIEDSNSAELAYEAGEVDLTEVTPLSLVRYTKNPPEGTQLKALGGLSYTWMGMNTDHPKLSDSRVRNAIQHAVDADSIVEAAYGGVAPRSYGIVPPGLIGKRNESKFSYDPTKASELLQASGVTGLSLTLQTLNLQDRVTAAQIIQANLAEVGVTVEVVPLDSGPFWNLGQESKGDAWKDLQLWIMRYGGSPDPFDHFQWFVRGQVGIWNWERWSSDEFEDLFAKGVAETDPAERHKIYIRMQEIMESTGGYVWLTHEPEVFIHRADINAQFAPSGEMQLNYFAAK